MDGPGPPGHPPSGGRSPGLRDREPFLRGGVAGESGDPDGIPDPYRTAPRAASRRGPSRRAPRMGIPSPPPSARPLGGLAMGHPELTEDYLRRLDAVRPKNL